MKQNYVTVTLCIRVVRCNVRGGKMPGGKVSGLSGDVPCSLPSASPARIIQFQQHQQQHSAAGVGGVL